ncbi:putative ORFan [Tupanvirus deep ocean]|uniref:ORFan n=2 Tax=Tupanvirus TaxID=2094720 RepID=A0AC62A9F4_9VIRU|nr:putative ORFan [Tupanvirus deep ocean]QKU34253.1 putative ORFan [Tupanvirus deep ocean]
MNYLPIFSPVTGTIISVDKTTIKIQIEKTKYNIVSPFFGTIQLLNTKNILEISISNNYLQNDLDVTINGQVNTIIKKNNIEYNETIANNISGDICTINFNGSYLNVVDVNTFVNSGYAIGYLKTHDKMALETYPKQLIILSLPHFICEDDSNENHSCDTSAEKIANKLLPTLSNDHRYVYMYKGNINRNTMDLNRKMSYNTTFRKAIRNRIKMKIREIISTIQESPESKILYLIDCHSFPDKYFGNIRIDNPDVSILFANCSQLIYVDELIETLKDNKINGTKHIGSGNDIIEEMYKYNISLELEKYNIVIVPILIEINETITEEKLNAISYSVNIWINTINNYYAKKFTNKN